MTLPPRTSTGTEPPPSGVSVSTKALIGLLLAGTVGILVFLFVRLSTPDGGGPRLGTPTAQAGCTKGQDCLPDVAFIDTNGVAHSAKTLAGKVVIVNFWATWCKPCNVEIPDLSHAYDKYKDKGVVVLGVLTSDNADNSTLLNFQSDHEMSFPVVRATSDIMASFDYPGQLPTTFVFDRNGRMVTSHVGALRGDKLAAIIDPLL